MHITVGVDHVINGRHHSLSSLADQIQVALECDLQLEIKVLLAISTQRNIIRSEDTVIAHFDDVRGRYGIGKQSLLDAGSGKDLSVVAILYVRQKTCQLGNTVSLDAHNLRAVDCNGIGLAVVHVLRGRLQEFRHSALVCALCVGCSEVTQNVAQNIVIIACGDIDSQGRNTVCIGHSVFTVVDGQSVDVCCDRLDNVHGLTGDDNMIFLSNQIFIVPIHVLTCGCICTVSGNQLHVRDLLLVDLDTVKHPDNSTCLGGIGVILLILDGLLDLFKGRTVHKCVNHYVNATGVGVIHQDIVDHEIHIIQGLIPLVAAEPAVSGLLKCRVTVVFVIHVILQLLCSVIIILDAVVLVEKIHEDAQVIPLEIGNACALFSERGNGDYRRKHCQTQQ